MMRSLTFRKPCSMCRSLGKIPSTTLSRDLLTSESHLEDFIERLKYKTKIELKKVRCKRMSKARLCLALSPLKNLTLSSKCKSQTLLMNRRLLTMLLILYINLSHLQVARLRIRQTLWLMSWLIWSCSFSLRAQLQMCHSWRLTCFLNRRTEF